MTKQFPITGTMKGASKEPDRKNQIIINYHDDDVDVTKDADVEADDAAHVWIDRITRWWRIK